MLLEEVFARLERTGGSIQKPAEDGEGGLASRIQDLKIMDPKQNEVPPSGTFKPNL